MYILILLINSMSIVKLTRAFYLGMSVSVLCPFSRLFDSVYWLSINDHGNYYPDKEYCIDPVIFTNILEYWI